jgi:hypothetical protein
VPRQYRQSRHLLRRRCVRKTTYGSACANARATSRDPLARSLAQPLLLRLGMAHTTEDDLGWTIPLHVIMWTTIGVGLIMALAVFLMH